MGPIGEYLSSNRAIAGGGDRDAILLQVVRRTAGLFRADACLLLLRGNDGLARPAAAVGADREALEAFAAPLDEQIGDAARSLLGFQPGDTFLGIPVSHDGSILGVLAVFRRAGTPGPEDAQALEESLLLALADQAAIALEHTARSRRAEEAAAAAAAAERKFRSLIEATPDPIVIVDRDARIVLVNGEAERCFGYPRAELLGRDVNLLIPVRFHAAHTGHHDRYFANPDLRPMGIGMELRACRRDGTEFPVEVSLGPLDTPEGLLVTVTVRDVTERLAAEQERALLLEREHHKSQQLILAVREAHHRIKNNLQAVTDLLSLELAVRPDAEESRVLRAGIERVQAIALVHDLLSHDQDVEHVDGGDVIQRLVPQVLRSNGLSDSGVRVTIDVVSCLLPSKRATTLALIVNELVSNAAKHAFGARREGLLRVSLTQVQEELLLAVSDDGPGLPEGFDLRRHSNVGMQVVSILAESDLKGRLALSSSGGVEAKIHFRP